MIKKIAKWALIALAIWIVVTAPHTAARWVEQAAGALGDAGHSATAFVSEVSK